MSYQGVRCSICSTVHDDAQLIHAKVTQPVNFNPRIHTLIDDDVFLLAPDRQTSRQFRSQATPQLPFPARHDRIPYPFEAARLAA